MGIPINYSTSSFDEPTSKSLPNPDPSNYSIIMLAEISGYTIVKIKYHDCVNYEGVKILVFKCSSEEILKQKIIDPHFSDNDEFISPIARFEPTEQGWQYARMFVIKVLSI